MIGDRPRYMDLHYLDSETQGEEETDRMNMIMQALNIILEDSERSHQW